MDTQLDLILAIKSLLQEHANQRNQANSPYCSHVFFDDQQQRYGLIDFGWAGDFYFHSMPLHLEVINQQIWIHRDDTDPGIAVELCERGIAAQLIILGFRPAALRQYTGFGQACDLKSVDVQVFSSSS